MMRLVITVFCILVVSVILAFVAAQKVEMRLYSELGGGYQARFNQGTFALLDEAIAGREGTELQQALRSIRSRFKFTVSLNQVQDLDYLPSSAIATLEQGQIYLHDIGHASSVHKKSYQTDNIWALALDMTDSEDRIASMTGPLALIADKLGGLDSAARSLAIETLQNSFGVPISIRTLAEIEEILSHEAQLEELSSREIEQLGNQQIVIRNPFDDGERYWLELNQSGLYIEVGPLDYPPGDEHISSFLILTALIILAIGCLLWMWPLWRDLQMLRRASVAIGDGQLETRVHSRRTSLIRPVLEGFNQMAVQTQNMVASQRELTNAVSHELRTPLARMMFDLEMAKQTDTESDRHRHLESLQLNITELNSMVDELLSYSRAERAESQLELDAHNADEIRNWMDDQVERARRSSSRACEIVVHSEMATDQTLYFNPQLMAHAVSNVLQNAMKFARGKIHFELQHRSGNWVLSVEDDGPGIAQSDRERVFDPFLRLDESRQRDSGGFGLGLSIVRNTAQWHQGQAQVVNTTSLSGTRLEILWPISLDELTSEKIS